MSSSERQQLQQFRRGKNVELKVKIEAGWAYARSVSVSGVCKDGFCRLQEGWMENMKFVNPRVHTCNP